TSDANDPFGGNDGKNQAILVPGGPVQVYGSGFRNPYDLVLTQNGRLYSIDNGSNAGWGDVPVGEGPQGLATNDQNEPGQTYGDGLHLITGPGYYGGHPNPTRSNRANTFNVTNPQSPVSTANPIESDFLIPGVEDGALLVYGASTNGLVEYTASNFQGALQGDVLAASFDNTIKRIKFNESGDAVVLGENLFDSVGTVPLDVTALGDTGPFPGTIWVADLIGNAIVVFEPNDYDAETGNLAPQLARIPNPVLLENSSFDVLVTATDPDSDPLSLTVAGLPPFAQWVDHGDGTATLSLNPTTGDTGTYSLTVTATDTGVPPLADQQTIVVTVGTPVLYRVNAGGPELPGNPAWQADTAALPSTFLVAGSSGQEMSSTSQSIDLSDASIPVGTPESLFQTERWDDATGDELSLAFPVTPGTYEVRLYFAEIYDGAQASGARVFDVAIEGTTVLDNYDVFADVGGLKGVVQVFTVSSDDVLNIDFSHEVENPAIKAIEIVPVDTGPANQAPQIEALADRTLEEGGTETLTIVASDPDGDPLTLTAAGLPAFAQFEDLGDGTATLQLDPTTGNAGTYEVTLTATDSGTPPRSDQWVLKITVTAPSNDASVLYRVNVGGPALATVPPWQADTGANPSSYLASNPSASEFFSTGAAIDTSSPTIPAGTPAALFQTERWDPKGGANMQWGFPVTPGSYEVRLYFAEIYSGAQAVGQRQFNVLIEGATVLNSYDTFADVGGDTGVVRSFLTLSDSVLDIYFGHDVENPALKGIEIVSATAASSNTPPTLDPIADQTLIEGTSSQVDLAALDADGDQLTFAANGLPSFATLEDQGDGTATLFFSPEVGDADYYPITVTVTDDGSPNWSATASLLITVTAPPAGGAVVYRVNAGGPSLADLPPWDSDVIDFSPALETDVVAVGSQLELFVDDFLIESMVGASLELHPAQIVPDSDNPLGRGAYPSILFDGTQYQHYYRDNQGGVDPNFGPPFPNGTNNEVTRYETSLDGIDWVKPELDLFQVDVAGPNNVILANDAPAMHNFSPFFDTNPAVDPQQRYKALAGLTHAGGSPVSPSGLRAYSSPDGVNWSLLSPDPVITLADLSGGNDTFAFDSSMSVFWSEVEGKYVAYYRTWTAGSPGVAGSLRAISRAVSDDFLKWTDHRDVIANLSGEHLYTSTVKPYFRAPQIYTAFPTRFLPGQTQSNTQILFMTSRDGTSFDRTFGQQVFMPGIPGNRQNYATSTVIPTGPDELSLYTQAGIRYTMRLDGFASIDTSLGAGEMVTRPLTFAGDSLQINFTTAGTGNVRVEILDQQGQSIPGYTLADSDPMSGDDIARTVTWNGNSALSPLAGEAIRLRFVMADADVYAMRFAGPSSLSLPRSVSGMAGEVVSVPVRLDVAEPAGLQLASAEVAIGFDPGSFTIAGARPGSLAPGFTVDTAVDYEAGTVLLTASGNSVDLPLGTFGDIVVLDLVINSGAVLGASPINLLSELDGISTGLNGGASLLSPSPTDNTDDFIDGSVSVLGALFDNAASPSETFAVTTEINLDHPSIPAGTPQEIFQTERFGTVLAQGLQWNLPVPPGDYEVRLYFAEIYDGATAPGNRVFDVRIEGQLLLNNYDVLADVGPLTGVVKSFVVASDDNLDIDLIPMVENPSIKAIEILQVHGFLNYVNALDVNGDDRVTPLDALNVINLLNQGGGGPLAAPPAGMMPSLRTTIFGGGMETPSNLVPASFVDTNGDDVLSPLDALRIINALNRTASNGTDQQELPGAGDASGAAAASVMPQVAATTAGAATEEPTVEQAAIAALTSVAVWPLEMDEPDAGPVGRARTEQAPRVESPTGGSVGDAAGEDDPAGDPLLSVRDLLFGSSFASGTSSTREVADEGVVEALAADVTSAWKVGSYRT
ncbi:MAG: malectin domain-containing carbohydrate-binding protein, partial [Pirellulales bacterium]